MMTDDAAALTAAYDDATSAFVRAQQHGAADQALFWLGASVTLIRLAQQAGVSLPVAADLAAFSSGRLAVLPDVAHDPLAQWAAERDARQAQARGLYQVILDQAPTAARATLAAAIQAVVAPQLAVQIAWRAQQLYDFLDLAAGIEQSPDDHTERVRTLAQVFAARVRLEDEP